MGTGFQIEVETGPGGLPARPLQGHHLGVVFLLVEVIPFGDDSTLFNQHRPYLRIGADSTHPRRAKAMARFMNPSCTVSDSSPRSTPLVRFSPSFPISLWLLGSRC